MRICKVKNCNKKHYARGYCHKHWARLIWYPEHREERHKYRNKYWKEHYIHKTHKCLAKKCNKLVYNNSGYCLFHKRHLKWGLPLDNKRYSAKGERNVNWRGGVFEYPNHYLMKKNRLIILTQNPKCEICGKPATEIHHKDFTKTNHKLSNLQAICRKCNSRLSGKFYKRYELTLEQIAEKLGMSKNYWWRHQNLLDTLLNIKE
jgi:5-methylcytosine-specific restriction endonuclease McrA